MSESEKRQTLEALAALVRYHILTSTTRADSGHPTSALSAVELMTGLLFGGIFRYDIPRPRHPNNDRLIFSKGHAAPLLYALWAAAGALTEADLRTYRQFGSLLEGHPTTRLPYVEAATGSLGQGLSVGLGIALNAKHLDGLPYRTYVLLGDSEMAEGSQWEAIQIAASYGLNNLVGILDVNRLGQRGETQYGHDLSAYSLRVGAFGWKTMEIDGHSFPEIIDAYKAVFAETDRPVMIIAHTTKGKGVATLEDQDGWHGKALDEAQLQEALAGLGNIDRSIRGHIEPPEDKQPPMPLPGEYETKTNYEIGQAVPTRNAYGSALKRIYPGYPQLVSLDGEVSNSTRAKAFKEFYPERFFEMYIAEQNMVGAALGLSTRGKLPFVSTFGAFFTRAFDQIRMSQYSDANIKIVGSHAGVSIGQDGPSQMALEDIAMFRSILHSVVLYPADAVATEKLVEAAAGHPGIVYIRTHRGPTPVIYDDQASFAIGGSSVPRYSDEDTGTIVAAGVTLHEALAAHEMLKAEGTYMRVIDLYSVQPLDTQTLRRSAAQTRFFIEEISRNAIVRRVHEILRAQ
ncbi:transketolase [Desulfatitalea alkaliphila]|uniref:Transketolase n=1 Tax=Desulfatitalea alkaliphila TaxID=2929485 RepID=A0AA41R0L2_9BACT|nr:transketolase [Desulfatitalea alkaliphila]MCJ8499030.1 transketolase [Desulfatitalea alkaliphila]